MYKRLLTSALLVGILVAGIAGPASIGTTQAAAISSAAHISGHPLQHRARVQQILRHTVRVTGINGNTINAVTRAGQAVTITVGLSTTYFEAGQKAALASVQPNELIVVQGKRTAPQMFQATRVRILLAHVVGVVTAVNGSTLTLTTATGTTRTVTLSATTAITRAGIAATSAAVVPNTVIIVAGTRQADNSINATRIVIRVAHAAGKVTAIQGSTITVQGAFGTVYTVVTSSSSVYVTRQGRLVSPATSTALQVGRHIVAYGSWSADNKTLTAARVVIGKATTGTPTL